MLMNQLQIGKVAGLNYQEMVHVIKSIKWGWGGEQKQILEDTLGSAQMRECSTRSFSEILLSCLSTTGAIRPDLAQICFTLPISYEPLCVVSRPVPSE